MVAPKQVIRQRDWSGGQIVASAKRRDDEAIVRAGAREMLNAKVLPSGAAGQRPGRTIKFSNDGRTDHVRMSPTAEYRLCFGADGSLTVRDSSDVPVARAWGYAWSADDLDLIVWDVYGDDVFICFPGQIQKVATWDGETGWTFADYAPTITSGGRKLAPFYRFVRAGVAMSLSALTGTVTATFSGPVLNASHVGVRFRYYDRQITMATVTSSTVGTATVNENLRQIQSVRFTGDVTDQFSVGDVAEFRDSGERHYVAEVGTPTDDDLTLIRLNAIDSIAGDVLVGPDGQAELASTNAAPTAGPAIVVWDEEAISAYRGYPRSVSVDQNRVMFCDIPGVPGGISWSATGNAFDLYVGALPTNAFFEIAPFKSRVYHVTPGADQFVFTDLGIYYIPISETNPLRPGSVTFRRIPGSPSSKVEPVSTSQGVVYVGTGLNRVVAIIGTGQTAQPYITRPVSDLQELLVGVTCLEVEDSGGVPPEDRVYAVNADGTVVVGRFQPGKEWVGWLPWNGEGEVSWISALGSELLFSTAYSFGSFAEAVDNGSYLDAAVFINDIPTALASGTQDNIPIHRGQGTAIGDMTSGGGVAAAFDGDTAQTSSLGAAKAATNAGAVGKTFGQPMRIAKVEVWPSTDAGFSDQANVNISIHAKQGDAPANYSAEGTVLATTGSMADTSSMQTLTTTDQQEWDHAWAIVNTAVGQQFISEVKFYTYGDVNGTGDLWFLDGADVQVMDGRRKIGERSIAAGAIVEQPGDDFSAETVVVGTGWTYRVEPFVPHLQAGADQDQAVEPREITKVTVAVQESTGFRVEKFNPNTEVWSPLNDVFTTYRTNESQDEEPAAREEANKVNAGGTEYDPRVRLVKDFPGPLVVLEISSKIGA